VPHLASCGHDGQREGGVTEVLLVADLLALNLSHASVGGLVEVDHRMPQVGVTLEVDRHSEEDSGEAIEAVEESRLEVEHGEHSVGH